MSITSLILGLTSFLLCLIPVVGIIAIIPIILSVIFGIISLVKMSKSPENKQSRAPSIVGIALSIVGLVIMVTWCLIIYLGISYFNNYEDSFTEMLDDDSAIEENVGANKEIESYKEEILENLE